MIREMRLFLWFVVGVLLSINAVLSFAADRCPPDNKFWTSGGTTKWASPTEACANNPLLSGYVNVSAYEFSELPIRQ